MIHIDPQTKLVTLQELGTLLKSDHPYSQRDAARLNGAFYRYEPWGKLVEVLRTGSGDGLSDTHKKGSLDFLQDKPELLSVFQKAMTNLSVTENEGLARAYDFSPFHHMIDIGGGHGTFIRSVLHHNQHLKGTIFDLRETLDTFEMPVETISLRLDLAEGNFFEPDTIPTDGDVYTLKNVLHNWPEEKVVQIMKSMHHALTADPEHGHKRVLVIEHLMSDDDNTQSIVPWMDLNFFILVGGKDRTLAEYKHIFDQSGFTITRVVPTTTGRSIIELAASS